MQLLDFTAKIIASLAWPVTLLAIIFFLRKPIKNLLPFLERLKYKDFELSFRRQMEEAMEISDIRRVTQGKDSELERLALTSPRSSVLQAWRELEMAAEAKLKELQPAIRQTKLGPDGALGHFEYVDGDEGQRPFIPIFANGITGRTALVKRFVMEMALLKKRYAASDQFT